MDLPPRIAALARLLRKDLSDIKKAIQDQHRAKHDTKGATQNKENSPQNLVVSTASDKHFIAEVRPNDPQGVAAQRSIKIATWFMAWSAFFAFIAASVYAGIAASQLCEMRKATSATQRAARAAEISADATYSQIRPWLKIDSVGLRKSVEPIKTLTFVPSPIGAMPELQFNVAVSNVGHTVAQEVHVSPELFSAKFNSNTWAAVVTQEEGRFCDSVLTWSANGAMSEVFPSDSPKTWGMGVNSTNRVATDSAAALIVCVSYKGIAKRSQTQAWFGLYENNSVFIKPGIDVDAASLRLIRVETGDHAY